MQQSGALIWLWWQNMTLPHWKVHAEMNVSICSLEGKYPDELEKEYAT